MHDPTNAKETAKTTPHPPAAFPVRSADPPVATTQPASPTRSFGGAEQMGAPELNLARSAVVAPASTAQDGIMQTKVTVCSENADDVAITVGEFVHATKDIDQL